MTDASHDDGGGPPEANRPAEEMRLRSTRPSVTRLSRKVLVTAGAATAIGISGALFFALKPQHQTTGSELYNTNNRNTPDGLANLPHDYTGLPKPAPQLGPPLPGDLGRPMLNAGASAPGMPAPTSGPSPEEQRIAQEQEAARVSHLFATANVSQVAAPLPTSASARPTAPAANSGSNDLTSQDHKLAFLNGNIDRRTTSSDRVQSPPSQYVLQAGGSFRRP